MIDNEIIKIENGTPILNPTVASHIAQFEKNIKELKAKEDKLKKSILEAMEKSNVVKVDTDMLAITYIAPTDRETLDSKSLRADNPTLYDEYIKMTPVKSSIRIKLK